MPVVNKNDSEIFDIEGNHYNFKRWEKINLDNFFPVYRAVYSHEERKLFNAILLEFGRLTKRLYSNISDFDVMASEIESKTRIIPYTKEYFREMVFGKFSQLKVGFGRIHINLFINDTLGGRKAFESIYHSHSPIIVFAVSLPSSSLSIEDDFFKTISYDSAEELLQLLQLIR